MIIANRQLIKIKKTATPPYLIMRLNMTSYGVIISYFKTIGGRVPLCGQGRHRCKIKLTHYADLLKPEQLYFLCIKINITTCDSISTLIHLIVIKNYNSLNI